MENQTEAVLRVEHLTFGYQTSKEPVLNDINLSIQAGELVGIVGRSGAGKSTLCLCLKGLIPHAISGNIEGDVWVMGVNVRDSSPEKIAIEVGMVFQDPESQIIGLNVIEDLAFGPENLEHDPNEILERMSSVLSTVQLQDYLYRDTYKLSGGQKQRLAIASALMMQPKVLILDEPTSELDPIGKEEVYRAVHNLKNLGVTVVLVDHAIEELTEIADRIIVLEDGRIHLDDTPSHLFRNPEEFLSKGFARVPQIVEALHELGRIGVVDHDMMTPYEEESVRLLSEWMKGTRHA